MSLKHDDNSETNEEHAVAREVENVRKPPLRSLFRFVAAPELVDDAGAVRDHLGDRSPHSPTFSVAHSINVTTETTEATTRLFILSDNLSCSFFWIFQSYSCVTYKKSQTQPMLIIEVWMIDETSLGWTRYTLKFIYLLLL
uniref:Uncharacterized protein n=1 Tax=Helianthus annuus TaxID=4232 RepID=A0A251TXN2_HELAN